MATNNSIDANFRGLKIVLAVGAIIRIVVLLGSTAVLWPDSLRYYRSAELLATIGVLGSDNLFGTPLYPILLSSFMRLGSSPFVGYLFLLLQHLLGLGAVGVFYLTAKKIAGGEAAFLAALLLSINPVLVYYETNIMTEILFVFFISVFLFQLTSTWERRERFSFMCLGISLALLTLTRPVALFLPLPVIFFLLVTGEKNIKAIRCCILSITFPYLLMLYPIFQYNYNNFKFFGPSIGTGVNLFLTVYEIDKLPLPTETSFKDVRRVYDHEKQLYGDQHVYQWALRDLAHLYHSTRLADKAMFGFALEGLKQEPLRYFGNTILNMCRLLFDARSSVHVCRNKLDGNYVCSRPEFRPFSRALFNSNPLQQVRWANLWTCKFLENFELPTAIISALACLGMLIVCWEKNFLLMLFATIVLYFATVTCSLNYWEDRYRLVFDPLLFLFASITFMRVRPWALNLISSNVSVKKHISIDNSQEIA